MKEGSLQVHAMGRDSGGCSFDLKGMLSNVKLDGIDLSALQSTKRTTIQCAMKLT